MIIVATVYKGLVCTYDALIVYDIATLVPIFVDQYTNCFQYTEAYLYWAIITSTSESLLKYWTLPIM